MGKIILALFLLVTALIPGQYWIHSSLGNDAWPGNSPDSAFATLGAATVAMSGNDTAFACGVFNETFSLSNNIHEGCFLFAWPDSTKWTIDGDSTRNCIQIGSYCGNIGEAFVTIIDGKIINSPANCITLGDKGSAKFQSCSLSTFDVGIYAITSQLLIEDCYLNSGKFCLYLNASFARVSNTILTAETDYCIKGLEAGIFISSQNEYYGYGGICGYSGIAGFFDEDAFYVDSIAVLAYRYPSQSYVFNKCLFTGSQLGITTSYYSTNNPFVQFTNCTFDSVENPINMSGNRGAVKLLNCIISNAGKAINSCDFIQTDGLILFNCETETTNLGMPINYWSFDPELDSLKVAQADSARLIGINTAYGLTAPLWDNRGKWFRSESGIPVIGWRSPYNTEVSWPESGASHVALKWGIIAPGRRLR
ncbi:hypothetical protein KAH81_04675 [bacterium]|nr:hypothetical protein [bacterium]